MSIAQAATLIAENHRQLAGRGSLPEAIKYYLENRPRSSPDMTVQEVADQLLALKAKEEESRPDLSARPACAVAQIRQVLPMPN